MPAFVACPHCQQHARASESSCPHCGKALRDANGRVAKTAAAVVMGLGVSGCPLVEEPQPLYGVPDPPDSSTTADPEPSVEPEYGVPDTSTSGDS